MLQHVTVKQPQAGIVCNKDQISLFPRLHQICVSEEVMVVLAKLPGLHPEMLAMQMHGVGPGGVIPDSQHNDPAKINFSESEIIATDIPIERP